jgi:hypothetical protein
LSALVNSYIESPATTLYGLKHTVYQKLFKINFFLQNRLIFSDWVLNALVLRQNFTKVGWVRVKAFTSIEGLSARALEILCKIKIRPLTLILQKRCPWVINFIDKAAC